MQSSLNLVNFIGTDLSKPFQIFGESDEAWRIKGGSSKLINALVDALTKDKVEMKLGYELKGLRSKKQANRHDLRRAGRHASGVPSTQRSSPCHSPACATSRVWTAWSASTMESSWNCINELGMGCNAKIMVGTKSRVWRTPAVRLAGALQWQHLFRS